MTFNSARNGEFAKKKWFAIITTLALFIFSIGLIGASVVSFFQTLYAFEPLNDPEIVILGIQAGNSIAFFFAAIFQYGQNAALFIKKHYCNGTVVANLWAFQITDRTVCDVAFWACAIIDGGTNCIWLGRQKDVSLQPVYIQAIEYAVMILAVWVEEVLGAALQGLSHSATELRKIIEHERGGNSHRDEHQNSEKRVERPVSDSIRERLSHQSILNNAGKNGGSREQGRSVHKNTPTPAAASRPLYSETSQTPRNEPTYHPINLDGND